ncbi:MAG TPA: glycosyltransferase family 9 protein, partial [Candidatus Paceibacterota bacterium]|nr:glycosyltransferase family 9 protein [Candidatus Paceibacterota bacterium]
LVIDNFRVLAQAVGLKTKPLGSPTALPIAATIPANFNLSKGTYIVVHPFGSNQLKSLPPERTHSILQALAAAHPQFSFVVTGGPQDGVAIQKIIDGLPRTQAAIGIPILEVAGLIQHAVLYIGVDTGITHLAAMMGKNMLALEHPTHPRWFPTYNPKSVMLLNDSANTREGLWDVSDSVVLAQVSSMHI